MTNRKLATRGAWGLTEKEEKKLRRLAILLAAQLPADPAHAIAALTFTGELVRSFCGKVPGQCPKQGACPDYHAMLNMVEAVTLAAANER